MPGRVIFRPAAEADLTEAYEWYEERERGLGEQFLLCVDGCIQAIRIHPGMYPEVYQNMRQGIVRRFPYLVFYLTDANGIVVVSIFHASRDPRIWKRRSQNG